MKVTCTITFLIVIVIVFSACFPLGREYKGASAEIKNSNYSMQSTSNESKKQGAYFTGRYQNLFVSLLGKSEQEVQNRIEVSFKQLFHGDSATQRIYFPVEPDMAYIEDVYQKDVRSEGKSYGMMIAVQLNKKEEFDRLWKWTKTYLQHQGGNRKDYFSWHAKTSGEVIDSNSASDGEEWYVMALFFASARWGDGTGIFNYRAEAQAISDAMLEKHDTFDGKNFITSIFNKAEKQIVFAPIGDAAGFTDPSYHLPHFYELWGRFADKNNQFWCDAAATSRDFLKKAVHPKTGLAPDYARFDGSPLDPWGRGNNNFQYDAWRVAMNIAVDYEWFASDEWAVIQSNRLLDFFHSQGIGKYGCLYTLDGKQISDVHGVGLVAMNAVAALASTNDNKKEFVKELWNTPVPDGIYRYYDGMLYMLAMLQVSGNFKVYKPAGIKDLNCRN
jgi:oligosaccharide reducing-end xylanase